MRNTLTIFRRDLAAYFTSPIGYIFMMVFTTVSVGLFVTGFFSGEILILDMRPFFDNLPLMLCVFIPAVTMRMWAEERKENTWEMLLTFPMRAFELVLGKYLAAMVFFGLTLAATVTVPVMLFWLGNPDWGVILGGYIGTALVGAMFFAMGIFFSGFFKDQIIAFVTTLLACFLVFLFGTGFIAGYLDSKFPDMGLGSMLSQLLGVFTHFSPFTRGVVDAVDVIYFVAWIAIFLGLNMLYIDGRSRTNAKLNFLVAMVLCVVIGLMLNKLVAGSSLKRFDITEDKINTVADASSKILGGLEDPVTITLYITPQDKMPTQLKRLEGGIKDKLEELRVASGGKLEYKTVYLEAANIIQTANKPEDEEGEKTEQEKIEERMLDKGVEPFSLRAAGGTEATTTVIYSSIGVAYADKAEEIIPQIVPEQEGQLIPPDLEYRLVSTVYKLTMPRKPVVAIVAPREAMHIDAQTRAFMQQMGQQVPPMMYDDPYPYLEQILASEKYDVKRVDFTKESPLPEEYDTLVVVNPRELNDRQRWEINRALRSGKSVIMAVQQYTWEYQPSRRGISVNGRTEDPQINQLLEQYGLGVSEDILMDESNLPLSFRSQTGIQEFAVPTNIIVQTDSMAQDTPITNNLSSVFYLWGTPVKMDDEKLKTLGLKPRVLMSSSQRAWTVSGGPTSPDLSFKPPAESEMKSFPLMVQVKGQFPDAFEGQERPAWPESTEPENPMQQKPPAEDPPAKPIEAKPGQLVLMGCAQSFHKNSLQASNLYLFQKTVDAITLTEELAQVRSRMPIVRTLNAPSDSQQMIWQMLNYGLANALIAGVGIALWAIRRSARNAYTMKYVSAQSR